MPDYGAIASAAKEYLLPSPEVREAAITGAREMFRPAINYMESSKAGKYFANDLMKEKYYPVFKQIKTEKTVQAEKQFVAVHSMPETTHAERTQKKLDIKALPTHQSINQDSGNLAKAHTFGENNEVIAMVVAGARKEKGDLYAQNLADHINMLLHDNNIKNQIKSDKRFPWKEINTKGVYQGSGLLERWVQSRNVTYMAPFIAIPHITNIANVALTAPLTQVGKGLAQVLTPQSYARTKAVMQSTGILADLMLHGYEEMSAYRTGKIAKLTGSPGVGEVINKLYHAPGFSSVRQWTLVAAGSVGKVMAEDMSMRFAESGDKRAEIELLEMGLKPNEIRDQKGILTPQQLERAIYRFTDNKEFLDNQLRRSYLSSSSPTMRMATLFHGFITAQGQLMRHEFMKAAKSGDLAQIAQFIGVAGVLFPTVGLGIEKLEDFAQGRDLKMEETEDNMMGRNGAFAFGEQWADGLVHMASFGIWASYARSITGMHLANAFLGPTGNAAAQTLQDLGMGAFQEYKNAKGTRSKSANWQPLERDLLDFGLPDNIGKMLAHKILPTPAEKKAADKEAGVYHKWKPSKTKYHKWKASK